MAKKRLLSNKARASLILLCLIVSVAMTSSIIFASSSVYSFIKNNARAKNGSWSIKFCNPSISLLYKMQNDDDLNFGISKGIGYFYLPSSRHPRKPYGYVAEFDKEAIKLSNIKVIKGRLPKRKGEIAIPIHFLKNEDADYKIGDMIDMNMGSRISEASGYELGQNQEYENTKETLIGNNKVRGKIVGIISRPATEPMSAPGYTILAKDTIAIVGLDEIYFSENSFDRGYKMISTMSKKDVGEFYYNKNLLQTLGKIHGGGHRPYLFLIGSILILLVLLGTVMLTYNSFSISYREKRDEYEIIYMLGGTKEKLLNLFLAEGLFYGIIGIPIGLISGVIGSKVIFNVFKADLLDIISPGKGVNLSLVITPSTVFISFIISIITLTVSLLGPAMRAVYTGSHESEKFRAAYGYKGGVLRNLYGKGIKVKVLSFLSEKFGYEVSLAHKNYKVDKRAYYFTVGSLILGIVLFLGITTVSTNIEKIWQAEEVRGQVYDISYESHDNQEAEAAYMILNLLEGVEESSYFEEKTLTATVDNVNRNIRLVIVDDETLKRLLEHEGVKTEEFFDVRRPLAIGVSGVLRYNYEGDVSSQTFKAKKRIFGKFKAGTVEFDIKEGLIYLSDFVMKKSTDSTVVMSRSVANKILKAKDKEEFSGKAFFKVNNAISVYEDMKRVCRSSNLYENKLNNLAKAREKAAGLLFVFKIFAYSFITFAGIMAIANVYNTIGSIMFMRRKEFAIYESIGITKKSFCKIIFFEGIFYSIKALGIGLPLGLMASYVVYYFSDQISSLEYSIPVMKLLMAGIIVFFVIMSVMAYNVYSWYGLTNKGKINNYLKSKNY